MSPTTHAPSNRRHTWAPTRFSLKAAPVCTFTSIIPSGTSRATTSRDARKRAESSSMSPAILLGLSPSASAIVQCLRMVDEDALRARYTLVEIDEEGVLLDRECGAVFRLNRTACVIWKAVLAGDSLPAIAAMLVRRFGIRAQIAERDASAALVDLPATKSAAIEPGRDAVDGRWENSAE